MLWGRCYESAGAPPYWPFVQALRGYVREHDPEQLRRELGSTAAAIAEIVPEIVARLPNLPTLPTAEPAQTRFRLFDSVTAFLKTASADQPIVLVLDDLHWADAGTLAMLEFLARELEGARLLILGTYRDVELTRGHPLAATLAELSRERLFERITLRGLDADDVGRFIGTTAGINPPAPLVKAVYSHTEGNPLFVTEVVRLLVQEGAFTPERLAAKDQWSVSIPEGVRDVIGRRLERLSERCQEILRTAAVVGREFSLDQLTTLTDEMTEERLLAVLEEALAARVIEELPRSIGRFIFTHALIQDTLVAELSATRRTRLHARIGESLERLYGDRADEHAAELAYHFGEGGTSSDQFVHYALLAGQHALAAYAIEEAVDLFRRLLDARKGSATDADTAAAMLGLGQALMWPRSWEGYVEALPHLTAAFEWCGSNGDLEGVVATVASLPPDAFALPPQFRDMVGRALGLVPSGSVLAARVLTVEGWFRGLDDHDYATASAAFEEAIATARNLGDRALEAKALGYWAHVDQFHLRYRDCVDHSQAALNLARSLRDDLLEMQAQMFPTRGFCALGEPRAAVAHADAGAEIGERMHDAWGIHTGHSQAALVYLMEGAWESARAKLSYFPDRGLTYLYVTVCRLYIAYQLETIEAGEPQLEQLERNLRDAWFDPRDPAVLAFGPVFADWIKGTDARVDLARERGEALLVASRRVPWTDAWANAALGLSAVITGDAVLAGRAYGQLQGLTTCAAELPLMIDHLLGLFAATAGRPDAAVQHYETALAFARRAGYRPPYGWAAADYAALLLERNADGDHAHAIALQERGADDRA